MMSGLFNLGAGAMMAPTGTFGGLTNMFNTGTNRGVDINTMPTSNWARGAF